MGFFSNLFKNKQAEAFDEKYENSSTTFEDFITNSTEEEFKNFIKNMKDIKSWKEEHNDLISFLLKVKDKKSLEYLSNYKSYFSDESFNIFNTLIAIEDKKYLFDFLNEEDNVKKLINFEINKNYYFLDDLDSLDNDIKEIILDKISNSYFSSYDFIEIFNFLKNKDEKLLNNFLNNHKNIQSLIDFLSNDMDKITNFNKERNHKKIINFFKEQNNEVQRILFQKISKNFKYLNKKFDNFIDNKFKEVSKKLLSTTEPQSIVSLGLEDCYFIYTFKFHKNEIFNKNRFKAFNKCLNNNDYTDDFTIKFLIVEHISTLTSPFIKEMNYLDFLNKFDDDLGGGVSLSLIFGSSNTEKWIKNYIDNFCINKYGNWKYRNENGVTVDREISTDEAADNAYFLISLIRFSSLNDGDTGDIFNWWWKKMNKNHILAIFAVLLNTIALNKQDFSTEYFKNNEKIFLANANSYLLLLLSFMMKDDYIFNKIQGNYSENDLLNVVMMCYANPLKRIEEEMNDYSWVYVNPIIDVSIVHTPRVLNYCKQLLTPENIERYNKKNPYSYALECGDIKGFNTLLNEIKYPDMIDKKDILQALGDAENTQEILDFIDNGLEKEIFTFKDVVDSAIMINSEYIFNHVYDKIDNPKDYLPSTLKMYSSYFFTKIIEKITTKDNKNEIKTILLNSIEDAILMNFDLHLEYIYNNTGEDFYKKDKQMNFIKIALQNKREFALQFFIDNTNLLEENIKYFNDYFIESYRNELHEKLRANRYFLENCSYLKLLNNKNISDITSKNGDKYSLLKFKDLIVNNVYIDIVYDLVEGEFQISNEDKKGLNEFYGQEVEIIDHKNNVYTLRLYSESEESKMIKNLKINNKEVSFFDLQNVSGFKYIYFRYIPGVTIDDWINEKQYIEDYLDTQIEIEKYDESNILYDPEFSKENLIVIKESMVSSIPKILNITGKYLKTSVDNGYNKFFFKDIVQSEWEDKIEEISKTLNSSLTISFERGIAILTEKVEAVIPKLLELKDSNGNIPILQKVKEGEGFKTFYYSFLPELDLQQWRDRSKKTNFRSLFNEMDKVYELGVYNKASKDYDPSFSTHQFITLTEYDAIPTKEELISNKLSSDTLTNNKVFMGYGKGRKKYEIDLNTLSHLAVVGSTGSGKSNLMNGIITSLLYNLNNIDKLYLMDLKGTEFVKYEDVKSDKITLFTKKAKPSMILEALLEIEAEMHLRTAYCQKQRKPKLITNPIYFVIDEFKQIDNIYCETSKDHNDKEEIYKALSRIGSLSRSSNIKLIIQTQGSKDIPEDIRKHCMSRILMKTGVESDRDIHLQNPDKARELGINHLEFDKGRYILEDDNDGDTIVSELQFPYVDPYDDLHLEFQNEYDNTMSNEFQLSLNEFIPLVKEEYKLLKNVSRLNPANSDNEIIEKNNISANETEINKPLENESIKDDDFEEIELLDLNDDFDFDSFIGNTKPSKEEKAEPEFFDKRNLQRLEEMADRFKD